METRRYRNIAIRLPATAAAGLEFSLNDQEDLKGAIIDGIETFNDADLSFTEQGLPVVTAADSVKLVCYYAEDSNDKIRAIPYVPQRTAINAGVVRQYKNLRINFPVSRIRVTEALANAAVSFAVVGVHYHYAKDLV